MSKYEKQNNNLLDKPYVWLPLSLSLSLFMYAGLEYFGSTYTYKFNHTSIHTPSEIVSLGLESKFLDAAKRALESSLRSVVLSNEKIPGSLTQRKQVRQAIITVNNWCYQVTGSFNFVVPLDGPEPQTIDDVHRFRPTYTLIESVFLGPVTDEQCQYN